LDASVDVDVLVELADQLPEDGQLGVSVHGFS
jgi:hypothetical protein